MQMELSEYIALSGMMFIEYAVWGAWAPVLATRLLDTLEFGGRKTGWIYATLPIACLIAPLVSGQVADQWLNGETILAASMGLGSICLFLASRQTTFPRLFTAMLLHNLFFAATLPLCNAILFAATSDIATQGAVFIWAPIGWAASGYLLSGWRIARKSRPDDRDCLLLGAGMALLMPVVALWLPAAEPGGSGQIPILLALNMLTEPQFALFIAFSIIGIGLMQFYFLGTAPFLQSKGIASKYVPGTMAIAQVAQTVATLFLLVAALNVLGFKGSMIAGAACWLTLYVVQFTSGPRWLLAGVQSFHGVAFMLFALVGMIYAENVAAPEIRSSVQALVFTATNGVGFLLGTQTAGIVMERAAIGDDVDWRRFWRIPAAIMAGVIFVMVFFFEPAL